MAFFTSNKNKGEQKNSSAQGLNDKNKDSKTNKDKKKPAPKKVQANGALEFGYWWLSHKETVKKAGMITAVLVIAVFLIYGIYGLLDYYVISYSKNRALYQARNVSLNWDYISRASMPMDIQTESVKVLRAGDNFDLVTRVFNPNEKWYVEELIYHFEYGGQSTETKTSYVLPGESTYLVELDIEGRAVRSDLVIEDLKWKKEAEFGALKEKFLQFDISDVSYIPARETGIEGERPINQVKFNIRNSSPQNFWNIDVIVLLFAGTQMRAVNTYHINSLDALETKSVTLNWPGILPAINKVSVVPQINILDPDVYKGFEETTGEEK